MDDVAELGGGEVEESVLKGLAGGKVGDEDGTDWSRSMPR